MQKIKPTSRPVVVRNALEGGWPSWRKAALQTGGVVEIVEALIGARSGGGSSEDSLANSGEEGDGGSLEAHHEDCMKHLME